ncbi:MAG: NUDIX domain-containing protein [Caulobacteraceae bacterium]
MPDRPAWMTPAGQPWTESNRRVVYENPWMTLTESDAVAPTNAPAIYAVMRPKNLSVGILPLHDDGTVTLVGQHRFVFHDYSWEIPEGGAPFGEDPLAGAKRELAEEAGLEAAHWSQVLDFQMSNSITDEIGVGYIATGLTETDTAPDPTEVLQVVRRPFREVLDLALQGQLKDMITVAMLLRAYHMAREGELPAALARAMLEPGTGEEG